MSYPPEAVALLKAYEGYPRIHRLICFVLKQHAPAKRAESQAILNELLQISLRLKEADDARNTQAVPR